MTLFFFFIHSRAQLMLNLLFDMPCFGYAKLSQHPVFVERERERELANLPETLTVNTLPKFFLDFTRGSTPNHLGATVFLLKLFKVNLMVTKANGLKSENKYLHLLTHPCIPSKEGNNGIYFLIFSAIYLLLCI